MSDKPEANKIPVIDNPHAPNIYATAAVGVFTLAGNAHVTFANRHADYAHGGSHSDVIVGQLIMPLAGLENMIRFLQSVLGSSKTPEPPPAARTLN